MSAGTTAARGCADSYTRTRPPPPGDTHACVHTCHTCEPCTQGANGVHTRVPARGCVSVQAACLRVRVQGCARVGTTPGVCQAPAPGKPPHAPRRASPALRPGSRLVQLPWGLRRWVCKDGDIMGTPRGRGG